MNTLNSKRFVLRQSLIGKNQTINVTFKNGKSVTYNHDKACAEYYASKTRWDNYTGD